MTIKSVLVTELNLALGRISALILIVLLTIGLIVLPEANAAGGPQRPYMGAVQPPKPDLQPISLYFNRACDLMAEIKNNGPGNMSGSVHYQLLMDGEFNTSAGIMLGLKPDATTHVALASSGLLGSWVDVKHEWTLIIDDEGRVTEDNESNNTITRQLICLKKINQDIRQKLPETR